MNRSDHWRSRIPEFTRLALDRVPCAHPHERCGPARRDLLAGDICTCAPHTQGAEAPPEDGPVVPALAPGDAGVHFEELPGQEPPAANPHARDGADVLPHHPLQLVCM
jgi:hypothetical protein